MKGSWEKDCPSAQIYELPHDALRQYTDALQVFSAHREAAAARESVRGSMKWKEVSGRRYLVRVDSSGGERGLGVWSEKNDEIFHAFQARRKAVRERLKSLDVALEKNRRLNRALSVGRAPALLIELLRGLDEHGLASYFRVVGAHAMYAYESAAGVRLDTVAIKTQDLDLLWDLRSRVTFHAQLSRTTFRSMLYVIKKIDASFEVMTQQPYTAVNRDGFMVDIIRRERSDGDPHRVRRIEDEDDFWPVQAKRANVLLESRPFSAMVVGINGDMAMMNTVEPLVFARFKRWMASLPDREPVKKRRDALQAEIVERLVEAYLPQWQQT